MKTNDITNGWGNLSKKQLNTIHLKKSTREQAIEWWNNLDIIEKTRFAGEFFGKTPDSLTDREIENICKQWHEDFVNKIMGDNKKIVDFVLLFNTLQDCAKGKPILIDKEAQNLNLFVDKLSESSSFAHKAHKELQRLNK